MFDLSRRIQSANEIIRLEAITILNKYFVFSSLRQLTSQTRFYFRVVRAKMKSSVRCPKMESSGDFFFFMEKENCGRVGISFAANESGARSTNNGPASMSIS